VIRLGGRNSFGNVGAVKSGRHTPEIQFKMMTQTEHRPADARKLNQGGNGDITVHIHAATKESVPRKVIWREVVLAVPANQLRGT